MTYNGLSIAGFVCSLVSLFFFPIPMALTGMMLSIAGYIQCRNYSNLGKGMSIAGMIISGANLTYRMILMILAMGLSHAMYF